MKPLSLFACALLLVARSAFSAEVVLNDLGLPAVVNDGVAKFAAELKNYRISVYKWVSKSHKKEFKEIVQARNSSEALEICKGRHSSPDAKGEKPDFGTPVEIK